MPWALERLFDQASWSLLHGRIFHSNKVREFLILIIKGRVFDVLMKGRALESYRKMTPVVCSHGAVIVVRAGRKDMSTIVDEFFP